MSSSPNALSVGNGDMVVNSPVQGRLAKCHNIDDLRTAASRRLPFPVFDFLDGGAEDERTLRRNQTAFDRYLLMPRVLRDVGRIDLRTTVLGRLSTT